MPNEQDIAPEIIALETGALRRWCAGDPSGFLDLSARDVVYFDPFLDVRLDGHGALADYYGRLRGKVRADRFELINPLVQAAGDAAVLTYNFVSFSGTAEARWNCTEVYRRNRTGWEILQTHWSRTSGGA